MSNIDNAINKIGYFLSRRDIDDLQKKLLIKNYGIEQVDVMVLFGGSIIAGGDILARAIKNRVAKHFIIVGGAGHTTNTLRQVVDNLYPSVKTAGLSEAQIFQNYIKQRYHLEVDWLEMESTNCGSNITNLLALLKEYVPDWQSIILSQDATMQVRMYAGLKKYVQDSKQIINYATYQVNIKDGKIVNPPNGMWTSQRYVNLLMGEIARLQDTSTGYGPKGKNFISHVDIPNEILQAFETVQTALPDSIRGANSQYAD